MHMKKSVTITGGMTKQYRYSAAGKYMYLIDSPD